MRASICVFLLFAVCSAFAYINPTKATLDENDNNVLRLALTLENLDSTFFTKFIAQYDEEAFQTAGYAPGVRDNINLLALQEVAHANILNDFLERRTGSRLPVCEYNFDMVKSVGNFVALGRLFENVGTGAYDGSVNAIYNKTLQQAAATIATVEARHAAFLNQLEGTIDINRLVPDATVPFPNATDYAFAPTTVLALAIQPFIKSCPYNYTMNLPTVIAVVPVPAPNASFAANPTQTQVNANDILTLNYALSLEHLEATFYDTYLAQYGADEFRSAGYSDEVYEYFLIVQAHERAHVNAISDAVSGLGSTPAPACTYTFPVTSVKTFVGVSQLLENTGVSAYDGAINTINDLAYRQFAATVATVEARHAAYINTLNSTSPYPSETDTPIAPANVIAAVSNFIVSCPDNYQIVAPAIVTINPYPFNNSTGPASTSTSRSSTSTGGRSGTTSTSSATALVAGSGLIAAAIAMMM